MEAINRCSIPGAILILKLMNAPLRHVAGPIADESDLVNALRARVEELNISRAEMDAELDLPGGYMSKRLTIPQLKYFGKEAFWNAAELLGLAVILVEDPHARDRHAARMKRRVRKYARGDNHYQNAKALGIVQDVARKQGSIGGKKRFSSMTKTQLRRHQREAANIRWNAIKAAVRGPP